MVQNVKRMLYMLSYIAIFLMAIAYGYVFGLFQSIGNTISIKKRKLKSLSKLVRTQYKNVFMIFWICICIISKSFYLSILQFINRSVICIEKNRYQINYVINGIQYSMIVHNKRGPPHLIQALDENDNDITDVIQAYAGPCEDFHRCLITPSEIGFEEVTLELSTGDEVTFSKDNVIKIL
jgi:hypothetical protein